jgi:Acyl carrier protein|tara:strand:- start:724 stop:972 length:249 start_codon:yes stop_codon:yes gene_type:complete
VLIHSDEEIDQKLEKIFLEVFEIDSIDMNATIDDVPEWDSFGHFELMMGIEKQFDIKIKMSDFPSMTSLPKIKIKIQEYEHE